MTTSTWLLIGPDSSGLVQAKRRSKGPSKDAFFVSNIFNPLGAIFVYILYSQSLDKYYVDQTEDLEVRIQFHNTCEGSRAVYLFTLIHKTEAASIWL